MTLVVKNLPANAAVIDLGLILGSGRSPGGGHGNPLQYSCLKYPTNREVWQATVHRVAKSQTQLKQFSTTYIYKITEGLLCGSGPHSFWHQASLSWKTVFPWTAGCLGIIQVHYIFVHFI